MLSRKFISRDQVLAVVMLVTVAGSLVLAVIDRNSRPQFLDLTKFAVGTYVGLLIPRSKLNEARSHLAKPNIPLPHKRNPPARVLSSGDDEMKRSTSHQAKRFPSASLL